MAQHYMDPDHWASSSILKNPENKNPAPVDKRGGEKGYSGRKRMNQINIIFPYKDQGFWMFDDESTGLQRELFVSGADVIMDMLSADLPNGENGFALVFSKDPFPGAEHKFNRAEAEAGGYWYKNESIEGWLCPALFKYFDEAPEQIYVQAKEKQ